jgi:hypothetical protein
MGNRLCCNSGCSRQLSAALQPLNFYSAETLQSASITFVALKFLMGKGRFYQPKEIIKITAFTFYIII